MNIVIIDNEPAIIDALSRMLADECPAANLVATANNVATGITLLKALRQIDLLFLDVELGDGTGMNVLKALPNRLFQVVFITGHEKYALDAFRFSAVDFLLKPFDPDEVKAAVEKAEKSNRNQQVEAQFQVLQENLQPKTPLDKKIVVKNQDYIHVLKLNNITHIEAENSYTKFHLENGTTVLASRHLKHFASLIAHHGFLRVHHSYLVNVHFIDRYVRADSTLMVNQQPIPVAHRRREVLTQYLDKLID